MKKKYITVILISLFIHASVAIVQAEEKSSPSLFGNKKNKDKEIKASELIVENKQIENTQIATPQQKADANEKNAGLNNAKLVDNKKKSKAPIINEKKDILKAAATDEVVVASVAEEASIQISKEGIASPEMNIDQKVLEKEKQLFHLGSEFEKSTYSSSVQEAPQQVATHATTSSTGKALLSLVVLSVMAGAGYWLLKNNKKLGGTLKFSDILAKKDKPMQVLQNLPIGLKHQILLLQYKNCEMIVGLSGSQFTLLQSFGANITVTPEEKPANVAASSTVHIPIKLDELTNPEIAKVVPVAQKAHNPIDQVKSVIRTLKPINQSKELIINEKMSNHVTNETTGFTAVI